jgi:hypothetical protein
MAEEHGNWSVETLTRLNHEKWFRLMGAKLKGKGVMYVLEHTLDEFARVAAPDLKVAEKDDDLEEVTDRISNLSVSGTSTGISTPQSTRIFLNIDKKAKYLKDSGTVEFFLLKGLDDDD